MPSEVFTGGGSFNLAGRANIGGDMRLNTGDVGLFSIGVWPGTLLEVHVDDTSAAVLDESGEGVAFNATDGFTEDDFNWQNGTIIRDSGFGSEVIIRYDPATISGARQITVVNADMDGNGEYKFSLAGVSNLVIVADTGQNNGANKFVLPISDLSPFLDGFVHIFVGDGTSVITVFTSEAIGCTIDIGGGNVTSDDIGWAGGSSASAVSDATVTIFFDQVVLTNDLPIQLPVSDVVQDVTTTDLTNHIFNKHKR